MIPDKQQKKRRRGGWNIFLIALFLLGLMTGVHFSQRMAGGAPADSPSQSPAPSQPASKTPSAPASKTPSEVPSESPSGTPSAAPPESPSEAPPENPSEAPVEPSSGSTWSQKLLYTMTLREKVCQMIVVLPEALTGESNVTQAGDALRQALAQYPVGGLLFDASNMVSRDQVRLLLDTAQGYSSIPLILTCDEEGGRVTRLMSTVGTTRIGPMLDYAHLGAQTAQANARTIAQDMAACGFNTDLAPVADVWSNPDNTVIGDRAYSQSFAQAAELIPAAVAGFHEGGVACTLKHFPGHGDTAQDSHTGAAYVTKTLDQLRQEELLPFRAGIAAGADMVMLGHLTIPDLDSEPAPFSYRVVTQLLREELGFSGVVITDSLTMNAVTERRAAGEAAVKAVQAGVDILLCPEDLEAAVNALVEAVEQGDLSVARIDESVLRILEMKQDRGLL